MSTDFLDRLKRGPILCDGAMGTQIHARGISFEHCFDELNLSQPEVILDVHRAYVEAGAEIIETNTFGANRFRLIEHELENKLVEINQAGVRLARKAADESRRKIYVAGSIGPLGVRLAPLGRVSPIEAYEAFKEQVIALAAEGVDVLIFETFSDLGEITQAIKAAKEVAPDAAIIAQMTFTEDACTPLGDAPELVAKTLIELGANVIGANCSVGPARLLPVIRALAHHAHASEHGPLVSIQPNAGWPQRMGPRLVYPRRRNTLAIIRGVFWMSARRSSAGAVAPTRSTFVRCGRCWMKRNCARQRVSRSACHAADHWPKLCRSPNRSRRRSWPRSLGRRSLWLRWKLIRRADTTPIVLSKRRVNSSTRASTWCTSPIRRWRACA
ncbi:MAG: homocysteine S-methyltransferase family protein [Anaerolineae bacterium]